MGNLYVIRHGQTTCNADRIIQGPRIDSLLSDTGERQAAALGGAFAETELDGLYVSPLTRARQTAGALLDAHPGRLPSSIVPELYEMDYGAWCGRSLDDVADELAQLLDAWRMGFVDRPTPGGESPVLAQHRVRLFANRLLAEARDRDIAVVAHGRINRVLLATLTQTALQEMGRFPQDNCNITHLRVGADGIAVGRINDTMHLPPGTSPGTAS